ncbi:Fic family protein [Rhizobium johnstonii]|uniref:Fic family protein n=1 Tax=Rhizobium johnstonii TaxID=3019933 RepID=UPI003F98940E
MAYETIRPLPEDFADAEASSVDALTAAWVDQREGLAEGGALATFNERLVRRWAIETGIIEKLYTIDRGTTELLVTHGLDSALIEHGTTNIPPEELVTILKDHRDAAGFVIDYVAQGWGLTAHFIKSVHALLCRHQDFTEAEDQFGNTIRVKLSKGEWKTVANNPKRPDGEMHEYCPPVLVNDEMEILLKLYAEMTKAGVATVIRAAWLHHRFTQIHPFQDGNGRVARALTAMVFVAAECFPIVVDREIRDIYIESLEKADAGEIRPLVRLLARLEKKEIEQALSMSQDVLAERPEQGGALRAKLLEALRDKARDKRQAITAKRKEVLDKGKSVFDHVIMPLVEELAEELDSILSEELPGSAATVERSGQNTRHFFKSQIVSIAQREGYFGDFDTAHEWVRLRLERPGDSEDRSVNEIVISMHSLGRHFTGVLVITAYFATRFLDEDSRSVALDPHRLADRSLTFSYREEEANISARVKEWTDDVLDMGLAQLQAIM